MTFVRYGRRKRTNRAIKKSQALKSGGATVGICSWNLEENGSPVEIDKLVIGAMQENPDVLCLQRANLPAPNTETNNFKWLCNSGTSGSAILLKKSSNLVLNSFEQFSDQICMADITLKEGFKLFIISCFIPPVTDYVCSDLWTKLKEIIGSLPPSAMFVLAGDFNAQIGEDNVQLTSLSSKSELSIRRLYHETSNENGKKLTDLIRKCHLRLFISQKKNGSGVFTFNDGKTKTQESFIILPHPRPSFSGEGYNVWHHKYNHAMLRFKLLYKPYDPFYVQNKQEGSEEINPPVIASWNIQSATPAKIDKVINEYNLPIVCIQELFLTSDEDIQTEHYDWLSTKKLWAKNVGILVKKCPNITVSSFEPLSEYFCAATIMFYEKPVKVISSHLPPVSDPQHEKLLLQMKELIKGISGEVLTVLGGDFSSVMKTEEDVPNADDFVKELANETNMEVGTGNITYKKSAYFTQVTETGRTRAHYILVSQFALKTMHIKMNFRWTPLFENVIVSLTAFEDKKAKKFSFDKVWAMDNLTMEVKMETEEDGVKMKTTIFKFDEYDGDIREDIESLVSANDIEKFKDTPPSAEDLGRMLKDFVLLKIANRKSFIVTTPLSMLVKSLNESKLGPLTVEEVTETNGRRICRLKWQNILLAEEIGSPEDQNINLRNKAANSVFENICQTCYTIRAKKTFFNKGKQPLLMDSPEFAEVMKKVTKSSFPTLDVVYKHIDEFISKDTDEELVFGTEFSKQDKLDIAEYVHGKNGLLDFRFFMSNKSSSSLSDNLAVFRKRSAQYLRDMLIKKPKNFKYYLIYPCGLGGDYLEFSQRFTADIIKEETELFNKKQFNSQNTPKNKPANVKEVQKLRGGEWPSGSKPSPNQNMRSQESGSRKRDFNSINSNRNGFEQAGPSEGSGPMSKKQKLDIPVDNRSFKVEIPPWSKIRPLVIVWPITVRSQLEERPEQVLSENFTVEFKSKDVNGQNVTAVFVALTQYSGLGKLYCIAKGNTARNASRFALDLLIRHCTVIKPNPNYLCNGRTPNFIRYNVPCQFNPPTYLILDRRQTGSLTREVIEELVERFLKSYEEEMFFDRDSYSFKEKLNLVEKVPKMAPTKLTVRHFGDDSKLMNRYVCVYKIRPKQDILQEVLKMRGTHPKFTMTTNRLPPGIEYNIY